MPPKLYGSLMSRYKNARDMIVGMNDLQNIAAARPPQLVFNWENEKTLLVDDKSDRGMIDIDIGLVNGVGKRFNEKIEVTKVSPQRVWIAFP